jgi:hypothetical protein
VKNYIVATILVLGLSAVFTAGFANAGFASNVNLKQTESGSVFGTPNWSQSVTISGSTSGTFAAGAFRVTDTLSMVNYLAFCFELSQNINLETNYSVNQTAPSSVGGLLNNLFTNSFGDVTGADEAAGFQIAIWEIVTDLGAIDLTSGSFILNSTTAGALSKAGDYLADLGDNGSDYQLSYFRHPERQDLILWEDNLSTNEASAPATSILIALSLGGLALVRRKLA